MLEEDAIRFDTFLKENDKKAHEAIKKAERETKVSSVQEGVSAWIFVLCIKLPLIDLPASRRFRLAWTSVCVCKSILVCPVAHPLSCLSSLPRSAHM